MTRARLTQGPVGRHLIDLTLPMLFGISTMMGQVLLDAWFLGQVGDRELAAHAFGFPVILIVTSVAIGLGAGTSSVVARAYGADDDRRTQRLATDSLLLSFVLTVLIALIGIATIRPLFRLLGAPEDMLPMIESFMTIVYTGVPFLVVGMVSMSCIRATGNAKLPGTIMVGSAVVNVVLDPILIFGAGPIPALGLDGAAWAGLAARLTVVGVSLYLMLTRLDLIARVRPSRAEFVSSCHAILHVGAPAAATNIIVPLGTATITALIADYGPDAVAGFGVASRIENMTLVGFYAMSSIIGPFVGQNFSAGHKDRVLDALRLSALACIAIGLAIAAVLALSSYVLPGLFSDSDSVTDVTRLYLWIAPLSYGAYGTVMVMNAAFNGLGKPMPGLWISTSRMLVLYVPLAFIGSALFGLVGMFVAYSIANLASGLLGYAWAKRVVDEVFPATAQTT